LADLDEMAALLRFVAQRRPVVAKSMDEIPPGCHVYLIGGDNATDWEEVARSLTLRGITFERITRKLSELFADGGPS